MLAEVVPADGDEVGLLRDVQQPVVVLHAAAQGHTFDGIGAVTVVKRAVIHPHVRGAAQR